MAERTFIIMVYSSILIMMLMLAVPVIFKSKKTYVDRTYLTACMLSIGWFLTENFVFTVEDIVWAKFLYLFKYCFIAFLVSAAFYLVMGYFRIQNRIPVFIKIVLLVIPGSISFLAISDRFFHMFFKKLMISIDGEMFEVVYTPGIGSIIMNLYIDLILLVILIVTIKNTRRLERSYKGIGRILYGALLIYVLGILVRINVLGKNGIDMDVNIITIFLCNVLFNIFIYSSGRADYLGIWRRETFDFFQSPILISNKDEIIVEANQAAINLFDKINIPITNRESRDIRRDIYKCQNAEIRTLKNEDNKVVSRDLYLINGKFPIVYEIKEHEFDKGGRKGSYIVFSEVTRNRLFIERLKDLAGIDPLTKLMNRHGYEKTLKKIDCKENLPLSVIFGDVNGLKKVNDFWGHTIGDRLLIEVAEIIKCSVSNDAVVSRIGGDEFVVLLANCTKENAKEQVEKIMKKISSKEKAEYKISVAFGVATKEHPDENINILLKKADDRMYSNKRLRGH